MKAAVVFFSGKGSTKLRDVAKGVADGITSEGHTADLIDGSKDVNTKLTMYEYVAVGAEANTLWGGIIDPQVGRFLSSTGIVSGKRSFAFITPRGIRKIKTLKTLMDLMEHEGMFLKNSQIVASYEEAQRIGRSLL